MDAENLLHSLPRFNRYQIFMIIYGVIFEIRCPWQIFGISFIADHPDSFKCHISANESWYKNSSSTQCEITDWQNGTTKKCNQWDYEFNGTETSIVNEWNLVCDRDYFLFLDETLYMAGQMVGALFLANISDWHGRKPTIIIGLIIHLALSVGLMLSIDPIMFIAIRTTMGIVNQVIVTASYVIMTEWFESKHRTMIVNSILLSWVFGVISIPAIALLVHKWRQLVFFYSTVPALVTIALAVPLTESLFYLVSNHKYKKIATIMNKVHAEEKPGNEKSGKPRSSSVEAALKLTREASEYDLETMAKLNAESEGQMKRAIVSIIHSKKMLFITFSLFWLTLSNNLNYYVATLESSSLSGDKYLNFVLSGVVEFPFTVVGTFLSVFAPRSLLLSSMCFLSFLSYICFSIWSEPIFAYIGRGAISSVYIVQLLFSTEMFPTRVRNAGLGFIQVGENLGPVLGPSMVKLVSSTIGISNIYLVFGSVGLFNALLLSCLPDTKGFKMPETVEDIEKRPLFAAWRIIFTRKCSSKKENVKNENNNSVCEEITHF